MDSEVWYVIEYSKNGKDDYRSTLRRSDSVSGAIDQIAQLAKFDNDDDDDFTYRVVRKTLTSEVIYTVAV